MNDLVSFKSISLLTDFTVRIDAGSVIRQASAPPQEFLELTASPVGEAVRFFIQPEDMSVFTAAKERALHTGEKQSFVSRLLRQRVLPVWMDCHILYLEGRNEYVFVAYDASHWKENETRLTHLSTHDALTGLPGRGLLCDRVNSSIKTGSREKNNVVIFSLSLNGFKKIIDSFGYGVGDQLIKAVVERLQEIIRRCDTMARVSRDEFVLVMMVSSWRKDIDLVSRKILATVQRPFQIQGRSMYMSISLGAAAYPDHGADCGVLLGHAETAMHSASTHGKNRWELYHLQLDGDGKGALSLESAMHEGIKNGEFLLHYQPVFCMQTGVLKGAEALMRWDRPGQGLVSPGVFIPLAESSGLVEMLGAWALRTACHQAKQWQMKIADFYISVNVSPRQFRQEDFNNLVDKALEESQLASPSLMLEITEGVLMRDPEEAGTILHGLRAAGVKIAIDDFGTGYSSLAYLKKLPLSVLKIDKSFVDDVPQGTEDVAIVLAILGLAAGLELQVVAEGVETAEQLAFLKSKGCDLVQGYLTGRPMDAASFQEKLIK
ncbi:MAG: bifunctional diguanylate cyclase/phosphodiesterase [Nitrosospira sp.]|nr:bifunctional diguanylate cyclase/phosphodiesterase [Nitrosospira sp.]